MSILMAFLLFILALSDCLASAAPALRSFSARIPITKTKYPSRRLRKRQGSQIGTIGLGDVEDT